MAKERSSPEILAPAGSIEGMRAAINAGCDAVYIGGTKFGARAYAKNLARDDMLDAIQYCHLRGVKVYLAVNTLFKDDEIKNELYEYVRPYYEAGLDAVIVQDVGAAYMLNEAFPDLKIHASTQMTLTMGRGASFLKKRGVTRIVAARELSLDELRRMKDDFGLEMEVFVHGAMCYSYSGQCLLSGMRGARSGNRGRCAQPCRMPYDVRQIYVDADKKLEKSGVGRYIFSMKELCCLSYIGELIEAGADSFKIEGRMKRPEYAALATAVYRKYVDLYKEYGKEGYSDYIKRNGKDLKKDAAALAEMYNRTGFTHGYLEGSMPQFQKKQDSMLSITRPNHGGVRVGEITKIKNGTLRYRVEKDIGAHDVIEFRNAACEAKYEYTAGADAAAGETVETRFKNGCDVRVGDKAYRTRNALLIEEIRNSYINVDKKIVIRGRFVARLGEAPVLFVKAGNAAAKAFGDECAMAKNSPTGARAAKKIIAQTGNTEFEFDHIDMEMDEGLFLPVGMLKDMRRRALSGLRDELLRPYWRAPRDWAPVASAGCAPRRRGESSDPVYKASIMTAGQLDAVLAHEKIKEVYIRTELMSDGEICEALKKTKASGRICRAYMPRVFRSGLWDREAALGDGGIYGMGWDGYVIRCFEEYAFLTERLKVRPELITTDSCLYVTNTYAKMFWEEEGVRAFTAPFELSAKELGKGGLARGMEAVIYAHIPLMASAQCAISNLSGCTGGSAGLMSAVLASDSKNRELVVLNYCKYCYSEVYDAVPTFLEERESEFVKMGIEGFRYDFTIEDAWEVEKVLSGGCAKSFGEGRCLRGVM